MKTKTLIAVDVQNDFCPGGALAVPDGNKVAAPLNKMAKFGRKRDWLIVASRDWHPEITSHFEKDGGIWPVHCVQNTAGAKFHSSLNLGRRAIVVSKGANPGEDAYSAFDGRAANGKILGEILKARDVEEVYVGGLATDYCVKATAIDAAKSGYKTFLLIDACRAVNLNPGDEENAVQEMRNAGVIIVTCEEVMKWKRL